MPLATPAPTHSRNPWLAHLRVCDWLFGGYMVLSAFLILIKWGALDQPVLMLAARVFAIGLILVSVRRGAETRHWFWRLCRDFYMPFMMAWLYVETGTLNKLILHDPVDRLLAEMDHAIFGYQPALVFWKAFPNAVLSEFMSFSYFSYYLIFPGLWLLFWFRKPRQCQFAYQEYLFITALVMVPCYAFYVAVPTWGPQYVYADQHSRSNFAGYAFKFALDTVLERGERPTGAFPSSHTALSVAILFLLWRRHRPTFWVALPPFTGLWISTVYIQAHFFVDIVAGMVVGCAAGFFAPRLQRAWKDRGLADDILASDDDPVVRNPNALRMPSPPVSLSDTGAS